MLKSAHICDDKRNNDTDSMAVTEKVRIVSHSAGHGALSLILDCPIIHFFTLHLFPLDCTGRGIMRTLLSLLHERSSDSAQAL